MMQKASMYLDSDLIKKMDNRVKEYNLNSRNELIELSLNFYIDYKNNKEPGQFMAKELTSII